MHPAATDTLTCDTARLARWWTDPAYDYERALHAAEGTWWDRLRSWLDWKLSEWFDWTLTDSGVNWVYIAAALVVLLLIVAYLWWKHPGLFRRVGRAGKSSAATDEDTIYGIDFPEEIRRATSREDYTAAVRYTYLYMLRQLDDLHEPPIRRQTRRHEPGRDERVAEVVAEFIAVAVALGDLGLCIERR